MAALLLLARIPASRLPLFSVSLPPSEGGSWPMHLFIHIGAHKTGTTSIQAFLRKWARELEAAGILVPVSCTLNGISGHHNLAFELRGDTRWDPTKGGLQELVAELSHSPASHAVLSSEDLSGLVEHPEALRRLESTLCDAGHTLSWLMLLRRADDYAESLYCTLWGCGVRPRFGFPGFVCSGLVHGKYRQTQRFGGTVHPFDFEAFARRWRRLSRSPIHFLDYDRAMAGAGVLPLFLEAIGAPAALFAASTDQPILNTRRDTVLRRHRRLLRPLLMARFQRRNLRVLQG